MHTYLFVIIRYSFLTGSGTGWRIAHHRSFEDYRAQLFDPDRLVTHERLFLDLALPSLQAQTYLRERRDDVTFKAVVATSTELPEPFKARLRAVLEEYDWAEVHELEPDNRSFQRHRSRELIAALLPKAHDALYVTASLDDDDALPVDYVDRLLPYAVPEFAGFGLSFGSGYDLTFKSGEPRFAHMYRSKTSVGLAYLNRWNASEGRWSAPYSNVYEMNHDQIDRDVPTIVDSRAPGFIRTTHHASDRLIKSGRRGHPRGTTPVPTEEVAERFEISALLGSSSAIGR